MAKNLIVAQGVGLGLDLNIIVDAEGVVNMFSTCCLDKFSKPSTFLSPVAFLNSSVVKFDKLGIIY